MIFALFRVIITKIHLFSLNLWFRSANWSTAMFSPNSDFQNNSTHDSTESQHSFLSTSADLSLNQSTYAPIEDRPTLKTMPVNLQSHSLETTNPDSFYSNSEMSYQREHTYNPRLDSLSYFSIAAILSTPRLQRCSNTVTKKRKIATSKFKETGSKRLRTIFTQSQLDILEVEFNKQQYMVGNERTYLAETLGLAESQVKIWFQNRRIKWRKCVEEKNKGHDCSDSKSPTSENTADESLNGSYDYDHWLL